MILCGNQSKKYAFLPSTLLFGNTRLWGAWQRARNKFLLPRETRQIYLGKRLGSPVTCWTWAKYYWKGPGRKEKLQAQHWLSLLERSDLFLCDLRCYYTYEHACVCVFGGGRCFAFTGAALYQKWDHLSLWPSPDLGVSINFSESSSGHVFVWLQNPQWHHDIDWRLLLLLNYPHSCMFWNLLHPHDRALQSKDH